MKKFKITVLVSKIEKIDDLEIETIANTDIWLCDETDYQTLSTECDGDPTRFAVSTIANLISAERHPLERSFGGNEKLT